MLGIKEVTENKAGRDFVMLLIPWLWARTGNTCVMLVGISLLP